jgi:hypothetical protein
MANNISAMRRAIEEAGVRLLFSGSAKAIGIIMTMPIRS